MAADINAVDWEVEVSKSEKPIIVEFWHEQCIWCQRLNPVYEELSKEYNAAKFSKLNVRSSSENMNLAKEYGVMGTPTMKVFCQGREVGEIVGFRDKNALKTEIDGLLAEGENCLTQSSNLQ